MILHLWLFINILYAFSSNSNENSPKLVELHESMMEQGIAYVTMNSGSKVSTLTNVEYNQEEDKFVPIKIIFIVLKIEMLTLNIR